MSARQRTCRLIVDRGAHLTTYDALLAFSLAAGLLTITPGLDTALVLRTAAVEGSRRALLAAVGEAEHLGLGVDRDDGDPEDHLDVVGGVPVRGLEIELGGIPGEQVLLGQRRALVRVLVLVGQDHDLAGELAKLRPMLSGRVEVDDLLARAEAVAAAASAAQSGGGHAELINHALLRATRALVPIDYGAGDRFEHEPALPVPAWPTLQPLRDLAQAVAGSDEAAFLAVSARRARNRVAFALRQAEAVLRSVA